VETRPDFVKLDMAITTNLPDSLVRQEVVSTVARIAAGLHAPLIVEGVERQEQVDALATLNVRYAQGYLLGTPEPRFQATPAARGARHAPGDATT
jgi:EAL domain-containing protein (putative c-di-GMP-specific phosphodiesterase class I)